MAMHRNRIWTFCKKAVAIAGAWFVGVALPAGQAVGNDLDSGLESSQDSPSMPSYDPSLTPGFLSRPFMGNNSPDGMPFVETYDIRAEVSGSHVRVETEVIIRNPDTRPRRGVFTLPLPEGAEVTGYAVDISSSEIHHQMVDAVVIQNPRKAVVKRNPQIARILNSHDADLDQSMNGNFFYLPIDVIHPRGYRRIRVSYTMSMNVGSDGVGLLSLPMPRNALRSRTIRVSADSQDAPRWMANPEGAFSRQDSSWVYAQTDSRITPEADFLLAVPVVVGEFHARCEIDSRYPEERFFTVTVPVGTPNPEERDLSRVRILWDASGSRGAEDVQKSLEVLRRLPEASHYELHVFRNTLDDPRSFSSRTALIQYLEGLAYDGATDYGVLRGLAQVPFDGTTLFFSDGMDSYRNDIPDFGLHTSALVSGRAYDKTTLWKASHGHVIDLNVVSADDAVSAVRRPGLYVYDVVGTGISDVQGIRRPAEGYVTVVGKWDGTTDKITIAFSDGREVSASLPTQGQIPSGRILAQAWAAHRMRDIARNPAAHREEILEIGRKYSIAGPGTDMVVLDTFELWDAFDIQPPEELAEIHAKWMEKHASQNNDLDRGASGNDDDVSAADNDETVRKSWAELCKWWENPIPKDLKTTYHCSQKKNNVCEVTVSSEYGEHYTTDFHPPKDWTCDEIMNCYSDLDGMEKSFYSSGARGFTAYYGPPFITTLPDPIPFAAVVKKRDGNLEPPDVLRVILKPKPRDPNTPYLKSLTALRKKGAKADALYAEFLRWKEQFADCDEFYFEVADFFFAEKMHAYGVRILSNLLERAVEEGSQLVHYRPPYLRRLQNAGELDEALHAIRTKIFGSETDWLEATYLDLRARRDRNPADVQGALDAYARVASSSNADSRHRLYSLMAMQSLAVWAKAQKWRDFVPVLPVLGDGWDASFWDKTMDMDLRVVWEWDDGRGNVYVTEPTTEQLWSDDENSLAIAGDDENTLTIADDGENKHIHSAIGGLFDGGKIAEGQYLIKHAQKGEYVILPLRLYNNDNREWISITIYRNWGRPNQTREDVVLQVSEKASPVRIRFEGSKP